MGMMSLLTRLSAPESPSWTSSDSIPLLFIPCVFSNFSMCTLPEEGDAREGHILSFPPMMLSPPAPIPRSWENLDGELGAYTTCLLLAWEGDGGQNKPLITFPLLLNPEVLQTQGKSRALLQKLVKQAGIQEKLLQTGQRHQQRPEDPSCMPCIGRWGFGAGREREHGGSLRFRIPHPSLAGEVSQASSLITAVILNRDALPLG